MQRGRCCPWESSFQVPSLCPLGQVSFMRIAQDPWSEGPMLGLMLYCSYFELLNNFARELVLCKKLMWDNGACGLEKEDAHSMYFCHSSLQPCLYSAILHEHRVLVDLHVSFVNCIIIYKPSGLQKHTSLSNNVCGSGVQALLNWVICLGAKEAVFRQTGCIPIWRLDEERICFHAPSDCWQHSFFL